MEIPEKFDPIASEKKWQVRWRESGIHKWDPSRGRDETFVVDTPPPTVSGSLHIGHVFSYTQTDILVRYQRMCGKNIAYPMGWDDNGLPTERRVQNVFGVVPNPNLPYDPAFKPRRDKDKKERPEEVSRLNFIELCETVCNEDEKAFEDLWRHLGLSVDWEQTYQTISKSSQRISQYSFLDLVEKKLAYQTVSPTMWDPGFRTAIAQAEVEDRERPAAYHSIRFGLEAGGDFTIATTRPELLGACIAVVAHPDDERYQKLFGSKAITPLFHAPVPILPASHADPEKGTGILMVCTFGDAMDVEWWKQSDLPLKQLIGLDGRMVPVTYGEAPYESLNPESANRAYAELQGKSIQDAQRSIVELLSDPNSGLDGSGPALVGKPEKIKHAVKFYERGTKPLEFVPTRQWFIRLLDKKAELIQQGEKISWHPEHMRTRYTNWVEGLNQDWCVSRQRYAGVPFPVWYPIDADGLTDYSAPIFAKAESLPVDPLSQAPPSYDESQRGQAGGFAGDPDVMDTWATSSLTPQILAGWPDDPDRQKKLFPSDLRPQAHEIIRTWAFYTIAKAWLHHQEIPWRHAAISGWILDPERKKMSKSKGNVVTPGDLLVEHSADAIRYWAGRARLGVDTAFDAKVFKLGRRLTTKLFNASRFALGQLERVGADVRDIDVTVISVPLDVAYVARLRALVDHATQNFENFDYAAALQGLEERFWEFCDDYLELVKARSYSDEDSPERRSATTTLALALRTYLRLFAPYVPYISEEVWSWRFAGDGRDASIHTSAWPSLAETDAVAKPEHDAAFDCAIEVLGKIRSTKTQSQKSLRWPITEIKITGTKADCAALEPVMPDILRASNAPANSYSITEGPTSEVGKFEVAATLAAETEA